MAFNIIAETGKKLDFTKLHHEIYSDSLEFDFVPMPGLGINGGDAIGICVPLNNANETTWTFLKPILRKLKSKFGCDVYDLYGGQKLGLLNIDTFKKNLLLTCTTAYMALALGGGHFAGGCSCVPCRLTPMLNRCMQAIDPYYMKNVIESILL